MGLSDDVQPPKGQSGATFPVSKSDGSKTVVIEGLEDFWVSKYKACEMFADLEQSKPAFITDNHISRYFALRNDGDTPSKAAKTLFSGNRYKLGNPWLKSVYDYLSEVK